jgi:hypothetical protein
MIQQLKGKKLELQFKWHRRNETIDPSTKKSGLAGISKLKSVQQKKERLLELAMFARTVDLRAESPAANSESYQVRLLLPLGAFADAFL